MVSFLTTFAAAALSFACARAAPLDGLSQRARDILGRAAPAAPRFVVYGDTTATPSAGPPAVAEIKVSTLLLRALLSAHVFVGFRRLVSAWKPTPDA